MFIINASTPDPKINQLGRATTYRILDILKHRWHTKKVLDS